MIRSMTGYGTATGGTKEILFIVEIKSVNHRFSDVKVRLPSALVSLEMAIRKKILDLGWRGNIEVNVCWRWLQGYPYNVEVNKALVKQYHRALSKISDLLALSGSVSLDIISRFQDIFEIREEAVDLDKLWVPLAKVIDEAILNLQKMKEAEGLNLKKDLMQRLEEAGKLLENIETALPRTVLAYHDRIMERLKNTLKSINIEFDKDRLHQEAVIFQERSDISEEVVRLKSHLQQFEKLLSTEAKANLIVEEQVGRRMDFLLQEMNRELSTATAKIKDTAVCENLLEMRSMVEKIREQIQNIE